MTTVIAELTTYVYMVNKMGQTRYKNLTWHSACGARYNITLQVSSEINGLTACDKMSIAIPRAYAILGSSRGSVPAN